MRGFLRQRGATWTAYWSTTDPATGNRRQHTKGGFRTKGAAQKYLNGIVGKVAEGTWRPDRPLTVKELLEEHWLPAQRSRQLRPSTLAVHSLAADKWIVPRIGAVRAAALTPAMVVNLIADMRTAPSAQGRDGLSARSAQIAVTVLKSAFRYGVRSGLLGRDPIATVETPRAPAPEMQCWTKEEARTFLAATADDRLAWAWSLLLTRGPRRGEVCGARWADIDLSAGTWRIAHTRIVVDGKPVDSTPKTRAGRRTIPLDPHLVALLKAYKARQAAEKLAAGPAYEDGGWLFCDELGAPYYPDSLSTWFDKKVTELGLRRIRLHDCRHTAASLMLASGVPVKVVSEMLGHASVTVTLAIYAHVMPGMAEEAGAALSASLLG